LVLDVRNTVSVCVIGIIGVTGLSSNVTTQITAQVCAAHAGFTSQHVQLTKCPGHFKDYMATFDVYLFLW